ncbi:hypothetical protein PPERSA_10998 [Pseudocohnilembus persalinus]|uniref:Uncharacterized protein n=1 Tax=Pseudocohnilembus persalinus TaxID=266149 RepID=A0A0V0QCN6_PSEPJ|nr:hypothetical protein PPERSA_10998 [Pseudocohnilembus persalinus]|eukprot:KRW99879.1 hypothetical protein PPERSA_10998 [Pseudocohnilembus persalinus]
MKKKQSTPQLYKNSYLSRINSVQNRSLENCQNTTNDSLSQLQKDLETSLVDTSYNDIYNKIKQEFDEMPQNQLKLIKNTFIKNLNEISILSFQKDEEKNIHKKSDIQLKNQLKSKPSNFLQVQSNSVSSRSPNTSIYKQDKHQYSQKNQVIDIQFLQEYEGEMEQNQKIKQEELEESYDYFTLDSLSIESNQSEEDEDDEDDKYTNQKEQQKKQKLKKHKSHKFQQKDQKSVKKKVNKQKYFQFETISKEMAERKGYIYVNSQLDLPVIRYLTSLEYIFNEARKNHKGNNSPTKTIKVLKQTQNNQNIFIYELNQKPNTDSITNTNTKQQKQKHLQQLKKINYQKHLQQKENEKNEKKSVIQIFIDLITDKFMKKDNLQLTPQQEFLLSSQVGMLALHQNLTKSLQGSVSIKKFPLDKPFYSIPYQESEEIQNLRKTKRNLQNDNRLQDIYHGKIKHLNKIVSIENPDNYIRDLSENQHPVKVFTKNLKN